MVTLFIGGVLLWEHFHGGIPSHHLLHQENLPSISNAWSAALLPILSWILLNRIEIRLNRKPDSTQGITKILWLFLSGLLFGTLLSLSFTYNYVPFLDNVLLILLFISFLIPIFYAEFILGFVLAMTITFGAILPTLFILIFATIGFVIYRFIRPHFLRLGQIIKRK